jgi:phospholipase C
MIIFGENESLDHYFGTYPFAKNPQGEPTFYPVPLMPPVNGLNFQLLNHNPNFTNTGNGAAAANPVRLDRTQAHTADPRLKARAGGLRRRQDGFLPEEHRQRCYRRHGYILETALVMGYYDGNTVTALWNSAQLRRRRWSGPRSRDGAGGRRTEPGAVGIVVQGEMRDDAGSVAAQQAGLAEAPGGVSPVGATNGFEVDGGDGTGTFTLYSDADCRRANGLARPIRHSA